MDSSILPLFAADEILARLGARQMTGCLKVFTPLESANVFFKNGLIVAVKKGQADGEEALQQILQWKEALFLWEEKVANPTSPIKPVAIKVDEFLAKMTPAVGAPAVSPVPAATGVSTSAAAKSIEPGSFAVNRTATKSITATAETRTAYDEKLLRRYQLALAPVDNPAQKFKIVQVTSIIGRNPGCDVPVPNPSISRQHCLLQITERGLHVKDLNTVNGTKVNGIAMKEGYLNAGDKLTVGNVSFVLEKTA